MGYFEWSATGSNYDHFLQADFPVLMRTTANWISEPPTGPDLRGNSQAPDYYGCFSNRNVNIAEARSTGFSRKDKCPEGISALFAVGIKSANSSV
jgi:hypothetical protein